MIDTVSHRLGELTDSMQTLRKEVRRGSRGARRLHRGFARVERSLQQEGVPNNSTLPDKGTSTPRGRGGRGARGRGRGARGRGGTRKTGVASGVTNSDGVPPQENRRCFNCGKRGHLMRACQQQKHFACANYCSDVVIYQNQCLACAGQITPGGLMTPLTEGNEDVTNCQGNESGGQK